ncbi:MAG: peptidoglycan DD-metalloendopeptidase family protein [bacterium]
MPGEGVFHCVQKGQTLWKIAQVYKVPLQKLCADNHLKSAHQIYAGQKLWISGGKRVLSVPATCSVLAFSWPLQGEVIRNFGQDGLKRCEGIDIQAPAGTIVQAAAPGQVIYASSDLKGYGKIIILQHQGGYTTVYAHNQENLVQVNRTVLAKEAIARVGQSGDDGGAYLHFEIRYQQKAFDPISYLP